MAVKTVYDRISEKWFGKQDKTDITTTNPLADLTEAGLSQSDREKLYLEQYQNRSEERQAELQKLQGEYQEKLKNATPDTLTTLQEEYANKVGRIQKDQELDDSGYYFSQPLERYDVNPFNPYTKKFSKLEAKRLNATASLDEKISYANKMANAKIANLDDYRELEVTMIDGDSLMMKDGIFGGSTEGRLTSATGNYSNPLFDSVDSTFGQTLTTDYKGAYDARSVADTIGRDPVKLYRQNKLIREILGKDADDYITKAEIDAAKAYSDYMVLRRLRGEIDGKTDYEAFNPTKVDYYKEYFEKNKTFKAFVKNFGEKDKFGRDLIDIADINKHESIVTDLTFNPLLNAGFDFEELAKHYEATKNFNEFVIANQYQQAKRQAKLEQDAKDEDGFLGEQLDILQARAFQLFGSLPGFFDITEQWVSENLLGKQAGSFRKMLYDQEELNTMFGVRNNTWESYVKDMQDAEAAFKRGDYLQSMVLVGMNAATLITTSLPDMFSQGALLALTGGMGTATSTIGKLISLHARRYLSGLLISGVAQTLQDSMEFKIRHGREMTFEELAQSCIANGFGFYLETALTGGMLGRLLPGPSKYIISTPRQIATRTFGGYALGVIEEAGTEAVQEYLQNAISAANVANANGEWLKYFGTELLNTPQHGFEAMAGAITGGIMSGVTGLPRFWEGYRNWTTNNEDNKNFYQASTTGNKYNRNFDPKQLERSHTIKNDYTERINSNRKQLDTNIGTAASETIDIIKGLIKEEANLTDADRAELISLRNELIFDTAAKALNDQTTYEALVNSLFELMTTTEQQVRITDIASRTKVVEKFLIGLAAKGSDPSDGLLNVRIKTTGKFTGSIDKNTPIPETVDVNGKTFEKGFYDSFIAYAKRLNPTLSEEEIQNTLLAPKTLDEVHEEIMNNSALGHDVASFNIGINVLTEAKADAKDRLDKALAVIFLKAQQLGIPPIFTVGNTTITSPVTGNTQVDIATFIRTITAQLFQKDKDIVKQIQDWLRQFDNSEVAMNVYTEFSNLDALLTRTSAQAKILLENQLRKSQEISDGIVNIELSNTNEFTITHKSKNGNISTLTLNVIDLLDPNSKQRKVVEMIFDETEAMFSVVENWIEQENLQGTEEEKTLNKQKAQLQKAKQDFYDCLSTVTQRKYTDPSSAKVMADHTYVRIAKLFIPFLRTILRRNAEAMINAQKYAEYMKEKKTKKVTYKDVINWLKKNTTRRKYYQEELKKLYDAIDDSLETKNGLTLYHLCQAVLKDGHSLQEYSERSVQIEKNDKTLRGFLAGLSYKDRQALKDKFNEIYLPFFEQFKDSLGTNPHDDQVANMPYGSNSANALHILNAIINNDKAINELSGNPLFKGADDLEISKTDDFTKKVVGSMAGEYGKAFREFGLDTDIFDLDTGNEGAVSDNKAILEYLSDPNNPLGITVHKVINGSNTIYYITDDDYNKLQEEIAIERKTKVNKSKDTLPAPVMKNGVENNSSHDVYKYNGNKIIRVYSKNTQSDISSAYKADVQVEDDLSDNSLMYGIKKDDDAHWLNENLTINGIDYFIVRMAGEHYTDGTDSSAVLKCKTRKEAFEKYQELRSGKKLAYWEYNGTTITQEQIDKHPSIVQDWVYNLAMHENNLLDQYRNIQNSYTFYETTTAETSHRFNNARALVLALEDKMTIDEFAKLYGEETEGGYSDTIDDYAQRFVATDKDAQTAKNALLQDTIRVKKEDLLESGMLVNDRSLMDGINAKLEGIFPPVNTVSVYGLNLQNVSEMVELMTLEEKRQLYTALQKVGTLEENERAWIAAGIIFNTDKKGTDVYNAVYKHYVELIDQIRSIDPLAKYIEQAGLGSLNENLNELTSSLDLANTTHTQEIDTTLVTDDQLKLIELLPDDSVKTIIKGMLSNYLKDGEVDAALTAKKRGYYWLQLQEYLNTHKDLALEALQQDIPVLKQQTEVTIGNITYKNTANSQSEADFQNQTQGRVIKNIGTVYTYNRTTEYSVHSLAIPMMTDQQGNSMYTEDPIYYRRAVNTKVEEAKVIQGLQSIITSYTFDPGVKEAINNIFSNPTISPETKLVQIINILYTQTTKCSEIVDAYNQNNAIKIEVNDYIGETLDSIQLNNVQYMAGSFNFAGETFRFNELFTSNKEATKEVREKSTITKTKSPLIKLGQKQLQNLEIGAIDYQGTELTVKPEYTNDAMKQILSENNHLSGNGVIVISESFIEQMLQYHQVLQDLENSTNEEDKKLLKFWKATRKVKVIKKGKSYYWKNKKGKKLIKNQKILNRLKHMEAKLRKHNKAILKTDEATKLQSFIIGLINQQLAASPNGVLRIVVQSSKASNPFFKKIKEQFKADNRVRFISSKATVNDDVFNSYSAGIKSSKTNLEKFRKNNGALLYALFDDGIYSDYVINLAPQANQKYYQTLGRFGMRLTGVFSRRFSTYDELATQITEPDETSSVIPASDLTVEKLEEMSAEDIVENYTPIDDKGNVLSVDNVKSLLNNKKDELLEDINRAENQVDTSDVDLTQITEEEEDTGDFAFEDKEDNDIDDFEYYENLDDFYNKFQSMQSDSVTNDLFAQEFVSPITENITDTNKVPADIAEQLKQYDLDTLTQQAQNEDLSAKNILQAITNVIINKDTFDFEKASALEKYLYVYYMMFGDVKTALLNLKEDFDIKQFFTELGLTKWKDVSKVDPKVYALIKYIASDSEVIQLGNNQSVALVMFNAVKEDKSGVEPEWAIVVNDNQITTKQAVVIGILQQNQKQVFTNPDAMYIPASNFADTVISETTMNGTATVSLDSAEYNDIINKTEKVYNEKGKEFVDKKVEYVPGTISISSDDINAKVTEYQNIDINSLTYGQLSQAANELNLYLKAATDMQHTKTSNLQALLSAVNNRLQSNEVKNSIFTDEEQEKLDNDVKIAQERQQRQKKQKEDYDKKFKDWSTKTQQEKEQLLQEYSDYVNKEIRQVKNEVRETNKQLIKYLKTIDRAESILTDKGRADIQKALRDNDTLVTSIVGRDETVLGDTTLREKLRQAVNNPELYEQYIQLIDALKAKTALTFDPSTVGSLNEQGYVNSLLETFVSTQISEKFFNDKLKTSKGKNKTIDIRQLTMSQKIELLTAIMTSDSTFNTVYKVTMTSQGFRLEMRDEVLLAMIAAGYECVKTNVSQKNLDAETLARQIGFDPNGMTTSQQKNLLKLQATEGSIRIQVEKQMGKAVCDALGIRFNTKSNNARLFGESNFQAGLGKLTLQLLSNQDRGKSSDDKIIRSEKTVSGKDLEKAGFTTSRSVAFIRFNNISNTLFAQLATTLSEKVVLNATQTSEIFKLDNSFDATSADTPIKGTLWKLGRSDQQSLDFINNILKKTGFTINEQLVKDILENPYKVAIANGYVTEDKLALMTPDDRLAAEGSNRTIVANIAAVKKLYEMLQEYAQQNSKGISDIKVFFDWEQMVSGRFQIKGSIFNVQNNKILRSCLLPEKNIVTHNTTDPSHIAFERFALAQAFDCTSESGRKGIDQLLKDTGNNVQLAEEFYNDAKHADDKTFEAKWAKYGVSREEYGLTLQAALHVLNRAKALSSGQTSFETCLMVEDDSTTSGYFLKMLMFPHPEILRMYGIKVGVFNNLEEYRQQILGAAWNKSDIDFLKKMEGFYDIYKQAAVNTAEHLNPEDVMSDIFTTDEEGNKTYAVGLTNNINEDLLDQLDKTDTDMAWTSISKGLPQAEYKDGVYKVSSALRKLLKPVVMIFGYSAGENTIRQKTGDELYQIVLGDLVDFVSDNDFDADTLVNKVNAMSDAEVEHYKGIAALFAFNLKAEKFHGEEYKKYLLKGEDPTSGELALKATQISDSSRVEMYKNLRRFQYFYQKAVSAKTKQGTLKANTPFGNTEFVKELGFSLDDVKIIVKPAVGKGSPKTQSYSDIIINLFAQTYGNAVVKSLKPFRQFVQVNNAENIMAGMNTAVYAKAYNNALFEVLCEYKPELRTLTPGTKEYDDAMAEARNMLTYQDIDNIRASIERMYPSNASANTPNGGVQAIHVLQSERQTVSTNQFLTLLNVYHKKDSKDYNLMMNSFDIHGIFDEITSPGLRAAVFTTHNSDGVVLNKTYTSAFNNGMYCTVIHDAVYHGYQNQSQIGEWYNQYSVETCGLFNPLTNNYDITKQILEAAGYGYDIAIAEGDTVAINKYQQEIKEQIEHLEQIVRRESTNKQERERCSRLLNKLKTKVSERGTALSTLGISEKTSNAIKEFLNIHEDTQKYDSNTVYESITVADVLKAIKQMATYYEDPATGQKAIFYSKGMKVQNLGGLGFYQHNPSNPVNNVYRLQSGPEELTTPISTTVLLEKADTNKQGILDVFDQLVDMSVDSPEHIQRLRGFLEQFLDFDELQGWLITQQEILGNTRGQADITAKEIVVQKQQKGRVPSGFNQSAATVYVHEIIHAMFDFAFTVKDNAKINRSISRLRALYNYVIEHELITVEDFLPNREKYTEAEYEKAKKHYDYIFNNAETSSDTGLKEFLSYLLSNDMMIKKLSNVKINVKDKLSLFDRIATFIKNIFKVITMQMHATEAFTNMSNVVSGESLGGFNGKDVYTAAVTLCRDIQIANTHAGNALARVADVTQNVTDVVNSIKSVGNNVLSPLLQKLTNTPTIARWIDPSEGGKVSVLSKLMLIAPTNKRARDGLYDFVRTVSQKTHIDWVMSFVDDMSQMDFGKKQIETLGRHTNKLEIDYQNYNTLIQNHLRKAFGELEEQDEIALSEVLRGNLQSLYEYTGDKSNIDKIVTLMKSKSARRNEEREILLADWDRFYETERKEKDDQVIYENKEGTGVTLSMNSKTALRKFIKNAALMQAAVMINGKGNVVFSSYDNSKTFVLKSKDVIDSVLHQQGIKTGGWTRYGYNFYNSLANKINKLATLYYLDNTDQEMLSRASELKKEGLDFFIDAHQTYIDNIKTLKSGTEIQREAGVVPVVKEYDAYIDFKIAPRSEAEIYEWNGYRQIEPQSILRDDSALSNLNRDKEYVIYVRDLSVPHRRDGSIVSTIGTSDRTLSSSRFAIDCIDLTKLDEESIKSEVMKQYMGADERILNEEIEREINVKKKDILREYLKSVSKVGSKKLLDNDYTYDMCKKAVLTSKFDGDYYKPYSYADERALGMTDNAIRIFSKMMSTQLVFNDSVDQNYVMVTLLEDYYNKVRTDVNRDILTHHKFVDLKEQLIKTFGSRMKELLKDKDTFYVREDWVSAILGVENFSITNWQKADGKNVLPPTARKVAYYAEQFLRLIAFKNRENVVIKQPSTILGNIVSNFNIHMLTEPNVGKIGDKYLANTQATLRFVKDKNRLDELEFKERLHQGLTAAERAEKNRVKAAVENNPVYELAQDGMFTNIVEDIKARDMESMADIANMFAKSKLVQQTPEAIRKVFKMLYMEKGTPIYDFFYTVNQYSDFVARVTEYQLQMEKYKGPRDPMSPEYREYQRQVKAEIWEAFIDYRMPVNQAEQYLNDIGFIWFVKYYRRIQRYIIKGVIHNPIGVIMQLARNAVFHTDNMFLSLVGIKDVGRLFTTPIEGVQRIITPKLLDLTGVL